MILTRNLVDFGNGVVFVVQFFQDAELQRFAPPKIYLLPLNTTNYTVA